MDFHQWSKRHNLSTEIVQRLKEGELDNIDYLKEFSDIDELNLNPEQEAVLGKALQSLRGDKDTSELDNWTLEKQIDADIVEKIKDGGFDSLQKLKMATEMDIKKLGITLGRAIRLNRAIKTLNDSEFAMFLRDKGINETNLNILRREEYDSKDTLMQMSHSRIEVLMEADAQKSLLRKVIQELKVENPISYEEAYEQFLRSIKLEQSTINKLKSFGMDSPEAMTTLNADFDKLKLSVGQRAVLDDAIALTKQCQQVSDMESAMAEVSKSNQSSFSERACVKLKESAMNGVIGAYFKFVAKTEGVAKPASANMASYLCSVGARPEPDKIKTLNGMRIVKLAVEQIYEDTQNKIRRCLIGKEKVSEHQKTIMLVGASGAGKSTLINGLCNYIFDAKWEENNRFQLIDEHKDELQNAQRGQTMSQTEWITIYTINNGDSNRLEYTLNLIDTPGFGDTRGITRDEQLVEQVRSLFKNNENHGIDAIDAVCFVARAPDVRLTSTQTYIFSAIMSVFGKDIKDNIVVMITFADGAKSPVLEAIKLSKLPFTKELDFNNSALYANNGYSTIESDASENSKAKFGKMFWDMGVLSFDTFFNILGTLNARSLYLTNEVLEQRRILKDSLKRLQNNISIVLSTMTSLKQEQTLFDEYENKKQQGKDFRYVEIKHAFVKVPCHPGTYVTHCIVCQETCHDRCTIEDDDGKSKCEVMEKDTGKCMNCKRKCPSYFHKNVGYVLQLRTTQEEQIMEHKLKRYKEARDIAAQKSISIADIATKLKKCKEEVHDYVRRCRHALSTLRRIAMKPDASTEVEYFEELIKIENGEHKSGYEQRIARLQELKRESILLNDVIAKNENE